MRNKIFPLFLLLFSILGFSQNPWLQGKGETLISPSVSHYFTDSQRDKNNIKSDFTNNGFYENYVYRIYFSTSLIGNKLNLVGNLPFVSSTYKDNFTNNINNELGDAEIGAKLHLKKVGEFHYLIGSVTAIIPLYKNNTEPFIAFSKFGAELKINLSGNSKWMGVNDNFHQIEFAVRNFFGGPFQYRLYGSQGYRITKKITLLADVDVLVSNGNNSALSQNNIQVITDFDFIKSSLSIGYQFSPKFELFAGGFRDLYNRNISIGRGWQVFGIIKL
jgi:hypothetical protein